ncbi:hypothetical protein BCU43_000485 [Vibrio lentus]|uniref:hypothetical protein n=2 Tax=Vibrionaceae TaxID=641 RepID=UPI00036D1E13|nr:hypothetical protein A6E08_09560 [Vibrio lentus]PMI57109.1 hypothetical protein BCU41_08085 [Vibrio lentus]PMI80942.1 hypothetical protein BCU36_14745 [Vibrio lentus]PMI89621.1 hypothetical protein BCU35_05625 [Vibrio lentus]
MEIIQKKRSIKYTFTFMDNHLNFAYKIKSGTGDRDLDYVNFPKKSSTLIEQNEWFQSVGYVWCILGAFDILYESYLGAFPNLWFLVLLGGMLLVWSHFSKVKYSVFEMDSANILVIQDKNHDLIINELKTRKKSQLLEWYGHVNQDNESEVEVGKFKWLLDEDVITKEEYEEKIAQIESLIKEESNLSNSVIH